MCLSTISHFNRIDLVVVGILRRVLGSGSLKNPNVCPLRQASDGKIAAQPYRNYGIRIGDGSNYHQVTGSSLWNILVWHNLQSVLRCIYTLDHFESNYRFKIFVFSN